jgi:predicted ribosome quality control (RQC) complex YloA/Tae2 family protein
MYFDAFTISALADEFMDTLVGGRVQDVLDVDETGIGMEIYASRRRHYLYMSAAKQTPRIHIVPDRLRRGLERPTQLGLLLRRYIEGGRLEHVSQPPWERILQLDFSGPEGDVSVIIEPMERRSNLLLLRDGIILDCMRRVGPEANRYRLSLPNHEYQLPPPMTNRYDPSTLTLADLSQLLQENDDPKQKTVRLLTSRILGMSPLLAKEVVYRATGAINQKAAEADLDALLAALRAVVGPLIERKWQPGIATDTDDETGLVDAFSVYPLTHLEGWRQLDSISAAVTAYYGAAVGAEAYAKAKQPVQAGIEEGRAKYRAKLYSLEKGLKDESERDTLQHSGELILAYQYTLDEGQTELRAQYDPDGPELVVKLDPTLTPLENAQKYFDKYNRAKRAAAGVPQLIAETRHELAYMDQLEHDLEQASNWPEIDEVAQALQQRGLLHERKTRRAGGAGQRGPLRLTKDGYVIWVGRNSRQNEQVTFKHANRQDLWLHARDVPGAHVVIRDDGRRIPTDLINAAASVAAYYSKRRSEAKVPVDVTRIKYVNAIKGAGPGMVTYRNEETLTVAPQSEEVLKD